MRLSQERRDPAPGFLPIPRKSGGVPKGLQALRHAAAAPTRQEFELRKKKSQFGAPYYPLYLRSTQDTLMAYPSDHSDWTRRFRLDNERVQLDLGVFL